MAKKRNRVLSLMLSLVVAAGLITVAFPVKAYAATITVTYDGNGYDSGEVPEPSVSDEDGYVTFSGPGTMKKDLYYFAGWSFTPDGSSGIYHAGYRAGWREDITVYAVWLKYQIRTMKIGEGTGTVTVDHEEAGEGELIKVTAVPDEGCQLDGLYYFDANNKKIDIKDGEFEMPARSVMIVASFGLKGPDPDPKPDPKPSTQKYEEHNILYNPSLRTGTESHPVTDGTWARDSEGKWTYKTSAYFTNTWGYIRNPYAKDGQPSDGWFYFDGNGKMLTGWQQINGKWYYLNPVSNGSLGLCYMNTTTPDGYKVGADGARIQ